MTEHSSRHPGSPKGETVAGGTAKHILVVDDDPTMREMISSYLTGQNFRVSAVADGQAMARTLRDNPVDLIVLDMKLADEDGLDLMRLLGSPPEAPVIIVTGHRREETDRIVGLELGADDYMTKPSACGN